MTRQEIIADHIATLRNLVANSDATTARLAFVRAIYAALATPGCEAQGVRPVDLPHLAERVAEMADAHERVVGERDALRAERDTWRMLGTALGDHLYAHNRVDHPDVTTAITALVRFARDKPLTSATPITIEAPYCTHPDAMRAAAGVKS